VRGRTKRRERTGRQARRIALVRKLWFEARGLFKSPISIERDYSPRGSQIRIDVGTILWALKGRNCAIELPTGTGKTLIALTLHPVSRVLLIVPTRTLVVQHFGVAAWVASRLRIDRLLDELTTLERWEDSVMPKKSSRTQRRSRPGKTLSTAKRNQRLAS
jgi:hypothetical protein